MNHIKLNKNEVKLLLEVEPRVEDVMNSLQGIGRLPAQTYRDVREMVALARKFNDEIVRPVYKQIDLAVYRDNDYLPREVVSEANQWGIYSLWIPKLFGGGGKDIISLYAFMEEIASVCVGLANVIGVHYLGVGTLSASWNIPLMNRIFRDVVHGSKTDTPRLLSLAITETEAGTDLEETILLDRAHVSTTARRVEGGYVLNGRKIFISMGHLSTWHMVIAYMDKKNPTETSVQAAVMTGTPGFSFGHHEKKMGQKACVASELIFEECFVPDYLICSGPHEEWKGKKSQRQVTQTVIDFVVSSSRAGVAAFGTGAARGAFKTALDYSKTKMLSGKPLINQQWAQAILAEMYKNVNMARSIYLESAYANALKGMVALMYKKSSYQFARLMPRWYFRFIVIPLLCRPFIARKIRNYVLDHYREEDAEVSSGWAALAKFSTSDLAMANSVLALELMGVDGTRHDRGAEKIFRDAKLLQIYEGTNLLNRITLFKKLVARNAPDVEIF